MAAARGEPLRGLKPGARRAALKSVRLLAPVEPVNVLCIGQNYKAHVEEGGDVFEVEAEGVGVLRNPVVAEQ
ncbi:MAG: hypothetical protein FJ225_09935 [Lentisphaerae bacterium]|nr:hypothetical protein [Lentisphaerota bacterium]